MSGLDPEGDWLGRGARALENPRTATGEHSLEKLHTLLSDLESRGVNSESFSQLKGKVPLRRGGDEKRELLSFLALAGGMKILSYTKAYIQKKLFRTTTQ